MWPGSLVLGQNQECYGACFSPSESLSGDMAALRIWGRAKNQVLTLSYSCPVVLVLAILKVACKAPMLVVSMSDMLALLQEDIRADMFSEKPGTELDLLTMYNFRSQDISKGHLGKVHPHFTLLDSCMPAT